MKILLPLLIIIVFLQSTIIPIDLALLIILTKSYLEPQNSDYTLAFIAGLLLSLLSGQNLALTALSLIVVVFITHIYQKSAFSKNIFFIFPLVLGAVIINLIISSGWKLTIILWPKALFEVLLFFPIFILTKAILDWMSSKSSFRLKL